MTLRVRLVAALFVLVAIGLAVFGGATYSLFARSEYDRLDNQLRTAIPSVSRALNDQAGFGDEHGGPDGRGGPSHGGQPPGVPFAAYGQLRDASGTTLATVQLTGSTDAPELPSHLDATTSRLFTTASTSGSGHWRVSAGPAPSGTATLIVAVPSGEVTAALHRLVLIEVMGGLGLLGLLSLGSWFVLRRGLRPLEAMADTAGAITAGDVSRRVFSGEGAGEVAQLGTALNTMLDRIEAAFAERDATEARLRQFLADASHELRTPLTSIQGFAELYRLDPEKADLPTILRRVEEESARMRLLVEDLLLLARLDQTRATERAPVDLAVLAADACGGAAAVAPDRRITLDAPAPVVVAGDETHLRQAIGNLVTNAVKHTPSGTPVEVAAALDDGCAVVTVRDHGAGLDADALAHAFDRFWQADQARAGAGAGLGLAIVTGIAAEHGGQATAANAPDGGAVFTLRLPIS